MPAPTVVVTFDPATDTSTTVDSTVREPFTCPEPYGWPGVCSAATLWALLGYDVTIRLARTVAGAR